ncbi:ABC transporter B family member 3-like isoform X2 [Wolffia australiana]
MAMKGVDCNEKLKERTNKNDKRREAVPYRKLLSFADTTDVFLMVLGTIGAIANGLSMPIMLMLFGRLVDSFGSSTDKSVVEKVSLQSLCLAIGSGVACFLQLTCWIITGERQAARIRNMYLKAILRQDIGFFDKDAATGEVVGRMSGDTVLIQEAIGEKVGKFIHLIASFIGGFAVALYRGWQLTLIMTCTIPPLVAAGSAVAVVIAKLATRGQAARVEASVVVEQTISAIRTVASFTGEKLALEKYRKSLRTPYQATCREGLAAGGGHGVVFGIMLFGYAAGISFGGKMILERGYTGGDVLTIIFSVLTASFFLGQALPCVSAFAAGKAAAYELYKTIKRTPEIDAYDERGLTLADLRGEIVLRAVSFSYPARPNEPILSSFSLMIPSGTTAALVGQSGSGKSTVISLIERFYDPQAGAVLIDGVDLRKLKLRWIRGKIGLVGQEPALFAASIRDNIAYGKDGATEDELRAAAELANAAKFIDEMPQGLDTMVGEHGAQLSGGQKQRIAIARAILKDPRILLLDEATSALDAESERVVQEALHRVMRGRTTVVVAHRLSTVQNADSIAVVQKGRIVEQGSHEALVKNPEGAYSQLIRLQESKAETRRNTSLVRRSISGDFSHRYSGQLSVTLPSIMPVNDAVCGVEKAPPPPSLSRLAAINKPEIPILLLGAVSAAVAGVMMPLMGLILSNATKSFFKPPSMLRSDTRFWALMFIVLGLVSMVAYPSMTFLFAVAGARLINRVRMKAFERVVHMEAAWFDEECNSSGIIGARLSADANMVRGLVGDALALLAQNVATLFTGLVFAFVANWQLSLVLLALLPMIGLNGCLQVKFIKGFSADAKQSLLSAIVVTVIGINIIIVFVNHPLHHHKDHFELRSSTVSSSHNHHITPIILTTAAYDEASQVANDAVRGIRTVASFSAEEKMMELYKNKSESSIRAGLRQGLIGGVGFGFSVFLLFGTFSTIFYIGARFVREGKAQPIDVFQVMFALILTGVALSQSSGLAPDTSKASSATASVFAILDRESRIDSGILAGKMPERVQGTVEFRGVCFRYPTRPDIRILKDFCLTIKAGKTVALVGESGCGKSTAIALLQRFYDPDEGQILLDGEDLRNYQLAWLRRKMGLVGQEPVLFSGTIRENIAYGKEGQATESEIVAAAQAANAHNFISSLRQGYETEVGERGAQLSGGQKQRVAIARAIVKDPRILLLDEATSALDAESEFVVQEALDRVMVGRTTVIVAHRLSTVKGADLIAVIKNGVIVEKGRHHDLIGIPSGAYAALVALQSRASS